MTFHKDGAPIPKHWIMGRKAFERRMPHHDGIKALWETKWKFPCFNSVYPFHDGVFGDFEPIFEKLIKDEINDPFDESYTRAFMRTARELSDKADALLTQQGSASEDDNSTATARASDLYLRACALYRIARFPYYTAYPKVNDAVKREAWLEQKATYLKAGKLWECPLQEIGVSHVYMKGNDAGTIPIYVRIPNQKEEDGGKKEWPVVVLMTGLDGYRPDNTVRCEEFLKRRWASVVVEIPGTADCPADPADPESPDRMWDSLLEWMSRDGRFDMRRVMSWGLSSGGYYAVRIAHTHKDHLIGCVAQGAGCHYFYDRDWLEKVDGHEYPFKLTPYMAQKHGFDSVEEYKEKAQRRFSLLETGIIQKPSTRLLVVNGTLDGLMPIEDSLMLFEYGSVKEGRIFSDALHMGYPDANACVYPWMEEVMASVKD